MSDVLFVNANALDWLKTQPDASFDAFFGDAPYGLSPDGKARTWDDIAALRASGRSGGKRGFMNQAWDAGVPGPTFWREVSRVLKPGAPVLCFGGTRTYHRMTCAIEDASLEIADCLMWIYGQGAPKTHNVSASIDKKAGAKRKVIGKRKISGSAALSTKEKGGTYASGTSSKGRSVEVDITEPATDGAKRWDGFGTGLRPCWEPCVVAFAPYGGATIAENVMRWGTGALNINGTRLEGIQYTQEQWLPTGRWPPNLSVDEVVASEIDVQSGDRPSGGGGGVHRDGARGGMFGAIDSPVIRPPDHGGASRFFYVAKVDKWERDFGCELLPLRAPADTVDRKPDSAGIGNARAGAGRSGEGVRNHHPTLKPIELTTRYARLILPPPRPSPRRLLNIFSGSGSEAIGAIRAGWDEIVCVEMDPEYVEIARHRVRRWQSLPAHMTVAHIKATAIPDNPAQVTIEDVLGRLA